MKTRSDEINQIFLWILLTGGLISLLVYGLSAFVSQPAAETITTHAPALNSGNSTQDVKFHPHKSR